MSEQEADALAKAEYQKFAEERIAAGDTPFMISDSLASALPHIATAEQLGHQFRIAVRDFRQPEFEEFVQRRVAAGDEPLSIIYRLTDAANVALDKVHREGKQLTKKQKDAVLLAAKAKKVGQ